MSNRPEYLKSGEVARLFPVLSETQKEGRTLSVLLATLISVREFRESLFLTIDQKLGVQSKFEAFTEVVFKSDTSGENDRPDGLIIISTRARTWRALIEAKVGKNDLTKDQVERYVRLARDQSVDAVITISNQFTPVPGHHPCAPDNRLLKKVDLFHWSWSDIRSRAHLIHHTDSVEDVDQMYILREFNRFLEHPSAGVASFTSMNSSWKDVVASVRANATIPKRSDEAAATISSWHQETQDLAIKLAERLKVPVKVRIARKHLNDPKSRFDDSIGKLCEQGVLEAKFEIPNAADDLSLTCYLQSRTIAISMKIGAPEDRVSTSARVNWLTRQLEGDSLDGIFVRANWPGRAKSTQQKLADIRENPKSIQAENSSLKPISFDVLYVREAGARFSGARTFIDEVEDAVPHFYTEVGQYLRSWSAPAPRMRPDDDTDDADVASDE